MQKTCCVFDMNGTLLDDLGTMHSILCETFESLGKKRPALAEYRRFAGYSDYWPLYEKHGFQKSDKGHADETFRKIFDAKYPGSVKLFDDVRDTMEKLRASGFVVAIVSSQGRKSVESKIKKCGLAGLIDVAVSRDDVKHTKPSAEPLLLAIRKLGVPPERVICVGDQAADLQMARNAGVFSVAVSRRGSYDTRETLAKAKPDIMINKLSNILRLCGVK
ncbi:MAG: HAD family hydrolase [Candidatus Aenigmarchaeota archaeon]|nr:HAD family hydrolase [Candidatus Aenigmarchaeota archaeon]